jgi:hypothetical protein
MLFQALIPAYKAEHASIIRRHREKYADKPCRRFRRTVAWWEAKNRNASYLWCINANGCFFKHQLPGSDTPYVFPSSQIAQYRQNFFDIDAFEEVQNTMIDSSDAEITRDDIDYPRARQHAATRTT